MASYIHTLAMLFGLLALAVMGFLDLRFRRIDHEWLYIIVLVCGLFSGGSWIEKIFCLLIVPGVLLWVAYSKEKKRLKREGQPTETALAINQIGGGDLKLIACAGFLAGPFLLAAGILLSIPCSIPFIRNKTLGMDKTLKEDISNGAIPLFTVLSFSLIVVYVVLLTFGLALN